jgi:hypothetical protein
MWPGLAVCAESCGYVCWVCASATGTLLGQLKSLPPRGAVDLRLPAPAVAILRRTASTVPWRTNRQPRPQQLDIPHSFPGNSFLAPEVIQLSRMLQRKYNAGMYKSGPVRNPSASRPFRKSERKSLSKTKQRCARSLPALLQLRRIISHPISRRQQGSQVGLLAPSSYARCSTTRSSGGRNFSD